MVVLFTKFDAQKSIAFGDLVNKGQTMTEAMTASASLAKDKFRNLEQTVNNMGYRCVYLEGLIIHCVFMPTDGK